MKRYAFILLVLLSAGAVRAQRYEKNILGVRAGVNVSTCAISIEDVRINTGSRAGFHFAVTDQILLHRSLPLYLETGIGFSSRGGRAAAEIYGDIYNMTMRPFYMQVPLLVNYHFHIRDLLTIQPFAGIYGGVGIRGAMKTEYGNEDMFSAPGFLSRMDFGVRAGARVRHQTHLPGHKLRHRLPRPVPGRRILRLRTPARKRRNTQQLPDRKHRLQFLTSDSYPAKAKAFTDILLHCP